MKTSCGISLFVCALAGCSHKAPPPPVPPAVRVEVVADAFSAGGSAVYSAVAQPTSTVPLAFRGPGYVADIMNVRASDGRLRALGQGDRVRRGDVVAHMRGTEYRDKLNQATGQAAAARASAEKARLDFERAKRLWATQSITKADIESATATRDATAAQVSAAEALLAEARIGLSDTALVAPIDGDVLKKNVEPGSFAGPGMPAFILADVSRIKVVLGLPDVALKGVALGQQVAVTTDALPGQRFVAYVSRIASAADPSTRNFDVEVEFPNPKRLWRPGMIASVELAAAEPQSPSPRLPLTAFVDVPGKSDAFGVMVVEGKDAFGKAHLRPVELADVAGNRVAVVRGLSAGDRVIVTGASIVAEGERVEVAPPEER
jgi:RND family efflux transporter MFP subunit